MVAHTASCALGPGGILLRVRWDVEAYLGKDWCYCQATQKHQACMPNVEELHSRASALFLAQKVHHDRLAAGSGVAQVLRGVLAVP